MKILFLIRAYIMKIMKPADRYYLATKSVQPLSRKFGFDRGTPIDRYWIEKFLQANREHIRGRVLEIVDNTYTKQFDSGVTQSDVLDLDTRNKRATVYGNLKHVPQIKTGTYDCIILTQVLGMIDDYDSAISECHRILKPGGHLLITSACFSSLNSGDMSEQPYWRFTPASMNYILKKKFKNVTVKSYGNVLAGQCFWVGMSQEELTQEELEYNDPYYACLVTAVCKK